MRREKMWPELEVGWVVGWVREHMKREAGQAGAESVCSGSGSHWSRATENHVDTADAVLCGSAIGLRRCGRGNRN